MRDVIVALLMGGAVGLAYGLVSVRSPAPPVLALLGLLAMTIGEQAAVAARARLFPDGPRLATSPEAPPRPRQGETAPPGEE